MATIYLLVGYSAWTTITCCRPRLVGRASLLLCCSGLLAGHLGTVGSTAWRRRRHLNVLHPTIRSKWPGHRNLLTRSIYNSQTDERGMIFLSVVLRHRIVHIDGPSSRLIPNIEVKYHSRRKKKIRKLSIYKICVLLSLVHPYIGHN